MKCFVRMNLFVSYLRFCVLPLQMLMAAKCTSRDNRRLSGPFPTLCVSFILNCKFYESGCWISMNLNGDSLSILHNVISTDDCSSTHPD